MAIGIEVETVYKIKIKDKELMLTKSELLALRNTINQLVPSEELTEEDYWALQKTLDVPVSVPRDLSPFAMTMLAVCQKYHKGYDKRAKAWEIVNEIADDYPELAEHYESKGRMSYATIFTADNGRGAGLVPSGLMKMKKTKNGSREYWVE